MHLFTKQNARYSCTISRPKALSARLVYLFWWMMRVRGALLLATAVGYLHSSLGLTNIWPPEPKVFCGPSPPKGEGVFAAARISEGAFVCEYQGQLLTLEEEEEQYPDRFPDYCLRVSPTMSIDGQNSGHWSRLINHNENANLKLHTDAEKCTAHFTAKRDIPAGEELCFDYGVAYFIFRQITPSPGTESRSLELRQERLEDIEPVTPPPITHEEIRELMESNESPENKKSSLLRGMDFYGGVTWMEGDQVELLTHLDGTRKIFSYSRLTLEELSLILETLWDESH